MPDVWVKQSTCTLGRSLEDFLNAEGFVGLLNAEMLQVVLVETEECRTWQHVVNAMATNVEHFKDFRFILTFKMKEVTLHRIMQNGEWSMTNMFTKTSRSQQKLHRSNMLLRPPNF